MKAVIAISLVAVLVSVALIAGPGFGGPQRSNGPGLSRPATLAMDVERGETILNRLESRCGRDARGRMTSGADWRTELRLVGDDETERRRVLLLTIRAQAGRMIELRRECAA